MKTNEFIEKAIEGGWNDKPYRTASYTKDATVWTHYDSLFLDPTAWQAVGKTEGWYKAGDLVIEHGTPEYGDWLAGSYGWRMHSMIDALAEGKTLEEYLLTLN